MRKSVRLLAIAAAAVALCSLACSGGTRMSWPSTIDCRPSRRNWRRIVIRSSGWALRIRNSPLVAAASAMKLATSMWSGHTRCSAPESLSRPCSVITFEPMPSI